MLIAIFSRFDTAVTWADNAQEVPHALAVPQQERARQWSVFFPPATRAFGPATSLHLQHPPFPINLWDAESGPIPGRSLLATAAAPG